METRTRWLRYALRLGQRARRRRRPPEALRLAGLVRPVEVRTDSWGVAHLFAQELPDLFFAQGFVTARDRLFQMDYIRHAARGRLCEWFGERPLPGGVPSVHLSGTTLDADVFVRSFMLEQAAAASLSAHAPASRDAATAFAAGVNAWQERGAKSLEERLLRLTRTPWRAVDCMLMLKCVAFELNFAWRGAMLGALIEAADLPADVAAALALQTPEGQSPTARRWAPAAQSLQALRAHVALMGNAPGVGSNAFVVAGTHTADGSALLANDTHLRMTAPAIWYEVGLHGAGLDLHGFALPGLPGVAIGRTPHHAWGLTAGLVQDSDLFVEQLDPQDPNAYRTPAGWEQLEQRREVFKVRGVGTVERTLATSRHGPIIEGLTRPAGERLALCWTGHRPGRELDLLDSLWRAESLGAVEAGLAHHVCPTYNLMVASRTGDIGYFLVGAIPRRRADTPLRPLEGWTGEWDWPEDYRVPWQENPSATNPPCGFLVSANNRPAGADYPHPLGSLFEPPARFERISELLAAAKNHVDTKQVLAIQRDTYSRWGVHARTALLPHVRAVARNSSPVSAAAFSLWEAWDGFAAARSPGAAIGLCMASAFAERLVRAVAGGAAAAAFMELMSLGCLPVLELARLQKSLAAIGVEVPRLALDAWRATLDDLAASQGANCSTWQWGRAHKLQCLHPLHHSPVGPLFRLAARPVGGATDTVMRGDMQPYQGLRVGAAMRFVAAAAHLDAAGTALPGGQSGRRLSPHYDDQLDLFVAGELKPAPMRGAPGSRLQRLEPEA